MDLLSQIDDRLGQLCKPPGSLGELESLAKQLCLCQKTLVPATFPRRAVIFAADHGVVCEGVTAWPSEVTAMVVDLMVQHRTASGVFANQLNCQYQIVDAGMLRSPKQSFGSRTNEWVDAARRRSSGNLLNEPAMTIEEFDHVWNAGSSLARSAQSDGCRLVIGGEMGIGNTTSASCLIGLLTGSSSEDLVGRGAGIDDAGLLRKRAVVQKAISRVRNLGIVDAKRIACEIGGLEIVALAGFYATSAQLGLTILLDGLIATSAALIADAMVPQTRTQIIAGHCSTEPGHQLALHYLGLSPLLNLQLRLGEATGALVALLLLDLAATMMTQMATLDELKP